MPIWFLDHVCANDLIYIYFSHFNLVTSLGMNGNLVCFSYIEIWFMKRSMYDLGLGAMSRFLGSLPL